MPANLENLAVATELKKVSFHSSPKERQCQIVPISHTSKAMPQFSKLGFNSTWIENPDIQDGFRKDRATRAQIANIHWIIEKAREFQENSYF